MNKTELVVAMADKAGLSKKDAEAALKAFTEAVTDELKKGGNRQGRCAENSGFHARQMARTSEIRACRYCS